MRISASTNSSRAGRAADQGAPRATRPVGVTGTHARTREPARPRLEPARPGSEVDQMASRSTRSVIGIQRPTRRTQAEKGGLRAAIYCRVSAEEQTEGYSLDAQTRACRQLVEERGWSLVRECVEPGRSARAEDVTKRPTFLELVNSAVDKQVDVIVVHKLDRFSRNLRVTLETLAKLERAGVTFVSLSENMDFTTPIGKVLLALLGAFAQYYSDNLSQEVKKGYRERKAQGLYGGWIPWGAIKGPDGVPIPDKRPVADIQPKTTNYDGLLLAFRQTALGMTCREVAQELNEMGYRPSSVEIGARRVRVAELAKEGHSAESISALLDSDPVTIRRDMAAIALDKQWPKRGVFTKDTVHVILHNRFYRGELPDGNGWVRGRHAPLIDEELWEAAQHALARHRTNPKTVATTASVWSLSGILRCNRCGAKMHVQKSVKYGTRLICYGRSQTGQCNQPSLLAAIVETQIEAHLLSFTIPRDFHEKLLAADKHPGDSTDLPKKRAALETRLGRIRQLFEWADITESNYLKQRDKIQRELRELQPTFTQHARLEQLREFLSSLPLAWRHATAEERNRLARAIYDDVYVDGHRLVSVRPRDEVSPFFRLGCHLEGGTCGPEEIRSRLRGRLSIRKITPSELTFQVRHIGAQREWGRDQVRSAGAWSVRQFRTFDSRS